MSAETTGLHTDYCYLHFESISILIMEISAISFLRALPLPFQFCVYFHFWSVFWIFLFTRYYLMLQNLHLKPTLNMHNRALSAVRTKVTTVWRFGLVVTHWPRST